MHQNLIMLRSYEKKFSINFPFNKIQFDFSFKYGKYKY